MARLTVLVGVLLISSCDAGGPIPPSDEIAAVWADMVERDDQPIIEARRFGTVTELSHIHLDGVMKRYIHAAGGDYSALANDTEARELLSDYLEILAAARPESMKNPQERLAFWLNAYNALVLQSLVTLVDVDGPDAEVSKDEFAMFTQRRHRVAGFELTLEELNHLVLRGHSTYPDITHTPAEISRSLLDQHQLIFPAGGFDARINFAISFGAQGFPPMPTQAYRAASLEQHLEERTQSFVNNDAYGVNSNGVSVLFHWFRRDFILSSGSVEGFINGYLRESVNYGVDRPLRFDWRVR